MFAYQTFSRTETMSSTHSSNSPGTTEVEEVPRKKGARGGKRSVTHLSKAQLARKRANDREAQRNIRQRTKEHIESLERKVLELEGGGRSNEMERALQRKVMELEELVEGLKARLARQQTIPSAPIEHPDPEMPDGVLRRQEPWMPVTQTEPRVWSSTPLQHHITTPQIVGELVTDQRFPVEDQVYSARSSSFDSTEDAQQLYSATMTPVWDESASLGQNSGLKPIPSWTPFHPSLSQSSRFADVQQTGFSEVINTPSYTDSTCWQTQPSVYAWQISTKLKAPVTHVDQLMFGVIHSQRHLSITSDMGGEEILGPEFPSVHSE